MTDFTPDTQDADMVALFAVLMGGMAATVELDPKRNEPELSSSKFREPFGNAF